MDFIFIVLVLLAFALWIGANVIEKREAESSLADLESAIADLESKLSTLKCKKFFDPQINLNVASERFDQSVGHLSAGRFRQSTAVAEDGLKYIDAVWAACTC